MTHQYSKNNNLFGTKIKVYCDDPTMKHIIKQEQHHIKVRTTNKHQGTVENMGEGGEHQENNRYQELHTYQ